nr:MAG TPA: hypothetical protein [Caudoviricetes sp.]
MLSGQFYQSLVCFQTVITQNTHGTYRFRQTESGLTCSC